MIAPEGRSKDNRVNLSAWLGLVPAPQPGQKSPFAGELPPGTSVAVNEQQIAYRMMYSFGRPDSLIVVKQDSGRLSITTRGQTMQADILSLTRALSLKPGAAMDSAQAAVPLLDAAGSRVGTLIVFSITGDSEPGRFNISHLDGLLLFDRMGAR